MLGLTVKQTLSGDPKPLAPAADLAAYRIIQEALTNVRKHSGVDQARLDLSYRPNWLTITVEDDGPSQPTRSDPGSGHGLIGMRERAGAVGGRVQAGPRAEGGFTVTAELPLLSDTAEDSAAAQADEPATKSTTEEGRA